MKPTTLRTFHQTKVSMEQSEVSAPFCRLMYLQKMCFLQHSITKPLKDNKIKKIYLFLFEMQSLMQ